MKLKVEYEDGMKVYRIPDWLASKKQFLVVQPKNLDEVTAKFVRETEKAICVIADETIGGVWLPKGQIEEWKYENRALKKNLQGKEITEDLVLDRVSPENIEEFGIEAIIEYLRGK